MSRLKVTLYVIIWGRRGRARMVVEFTTTCATTKVVSQYPAHGKV